MKKVFTIVICVIFVLSSLSGCQKSDPQNASSVNSRTQSDAPALKDESVYSALDNKMIAWGLKKNEGKAPDVPSLVTKVLDKYNAKYISDNEKCLYLTFDEGYENGYSAQILDVLKDTNTPAAFFITGDYIKKESELVKRMVNEGHIVGNHTQNHPSMPGVRSAVALAKELNELDDSFYQLTGEHMRYIRPPKGEFSERTLAISADLGYKTVFWSFAYADWHTDKIYGAQYAYDHVMPYLHDGAVLLLHAVSKDNADALYQIIADAKAKGYTFKSLDEL